MANLLDSYGLDFLGKDEDTLMGAVRYTVQEGKAIKGYYDTPYFYLPIGSAEFWASSEKSEDGKLAISGFHTHCGGKTIWEMICTDVDISPKDWPKTERILMMSRSTENGGMLPVDIITADVLPSFLKDDRLTLQLVAPCLEVNYYATEEEYDKTVPADKQGQKWGIADGALIPLSFLANHLVGNYEDGKEYDESKPGTSLNKCIRFCYELKAGDIAVIVDNNRVAFAYIGEYYEEQSPTLTVELEKEVHQQIEKANPNTDTFTCPYIKRRKITLIKVLTADDTISPYLQSAIARNWHSLSDLNEYAELVLSGCFDTVLFKDKLTVTFRVKRKEEINVLDLANFVLCAARLLSDDKPETVQVKTTLHSPGDVILQIWNFAQENAFPLLICYMAIFGGKAGDYEFHSIIGVIKGIINHKYDEDKKKSN